MYRRRRGGFRRRSAGTRWFQPGLWTQGQEAIVNDNLTSAPAQTFQQEPSLVSLLRGAAPFPGVNNAAGRLAGTMLAERQYYKINRVVGRLHFWAFTQIGGDDFTTQFGALCRVFWSIIRWNTDEQGVPDSQGPGQGFFDSSVGTNQDERKIIVAQDVWSREFPPATQFNTDGQFWEIPGPGPLFNMIDLRMKRPVSNEQELFLCTTVWWHLFSPNENWPSGSVFQLRSHYNLRPYGRLGR